MTHVEELISALNDLVLIHNDRIEGYHQAVESIDQKDYDLKMIFAKMISNSLDHNSVLENLIHDAGGEIERGTTTTGKIFRSWISIKSTFSTKDRISVLESCEAGEDSAMNAYDMALASDDEMSTDVRQILLEQKASLKADHDQIKRLRDLHRKFA
ncbi:PA2169 family four-helix-bundle protein [Aquiflexum sp.]|uniref:PA2169 family four-helix-bundle protein n=1 Tax=Aquiflexum sp. TaxID=1872584 RepID=UPI0035945DFC